VSAGSDPERQGEVAACGVMTYNDTEPIMPFKQHPRNELILGIVFLLGGIVMTIDAIRTAHPFSAWYGGFSLMAGMGTIESWRLRRKLAQIEAKNAELRGDTEAAATT
jgi:hypothetical protein